MSLPDVVRILGHVLRGRRRLYQCFTTVNWRTCAACLSWHGRIVPRPQEFAGRRDSCPHEVLAFPVWRLPEHLRKGERMRARAAEELARREKWRQAQDLLVRDADGALRLFAEASRVDVHLPEVEELVARHGPWLAEHAGTRAALREVLVAGWKAKFAKERYERQPELARTAQEKYGLERLHELLP